MSVTSTAAAFAPLTPLTSFHCPAHHLTTPAVRAPRAAPSITRRRWSPRRHAAPRMQAPPADPAPSSGNAARTERATDGRGFLLPQAGDVVLYAGRWRSEDAAGLVDEVRFLPSRSAHVVDVRPLRRVAGDLFAVPSARQRARPIWLDVADVRIVPHAHYVATQDAYRVSGARDGYAKIAPPTEEERRVINEDYVAMQRGMMRTTVATVATGTLLALLVRNPETAFSFALGGAASVTYLWMLHRAVDAVGPVTADTPRAPFWQRLLLLRFAVPALPFLVLYLLTAPPSTQPAGAGILGSLSRGNALAVVLGLLAYKVPLFSRAAAEFVDSVADIEMGTTGMIGTTASLIARRVRARRDGASAQGAESGDSPPSTGAGGQRVLVFAGPSGAGKSTLISRLLQTRTATSGAEADGAPADRMAYSVSHTTREMRPGERDGIDYNFVSKDDFEAMVSRGDFVEHALVHGWYYGTSFASVGQVLTSGQICVLDIDVQGIDAIREGQGGVDWDVRMVWVAPPSVDVLEGRLRDRGTETEATIRRRLDTAMREMEYAATNNVFDLILVNDDVDRAFAELGAFVDQCEREWDEACTLSQSSSSSS